MSAESPEEIVKAIEFMRTQYTGGRGPESIFYPTFNLPSDEDRYGHFLRELAILCSEYLQETAGGEIYLDNLCMTAGEEAFVVLEKHGLITVDPRGYRCAHWTDEGQKLLATSRLAMEDQSNTTPEMQT